MKHISMLIISKTNYFQLWYKSDLRISTAGNLWELSESNTFNLIKGHYLLHYSSDKYDKGTVTFFALRVS